MRFYLEIRRESDGAIESTDNTVMDSEQEALADAKRWLAEALTLDSYQKEILVIVEETNECIYQGTFDLVPSC